MATVAELTRKLSTAAVTPTDPVTNALFKKFEKVTVIERKRKKNYLVTYFAVLFACLIFSAAEYSLILPACYVCK